VAKIRRAGIDARIVEVRIRLDAEAGQRWRAPRNNGAIAGAMGPVSCRDATGSKIVKSPNWTRGELNSEPVELFSARKQ